jgi:hypothetical protein
VVHNLIVHFVQNPECLSDRRVYTFVLVHALWFTTYAATAGPSGTMHASFDGAYPAAGLMVRAWQHCLAASSAVTFQTCHAGYVLVCVWQYTSRGVLKYTVFGSTQAEGC